jgi:hypothetical protein
MSNCATLTKISTDRNSAKYRGATPLVVPKMIYPIAPTMPKPATNGPRTPTRSEIQATAQITIQQSRKGGAERPLDCEAVKAPISEMMVGTKRGRLAKQTLQPK